MSTPNKQLIAAIQRIAEGSPLFTEVRGLLKEIQRRGGIEGLSLKIGADDESGGDCCTDPDETGEPTESTASDISGDAPADLSGGIDEDWKDCETGQAIRFTPAGFAQVESCKQCVPDETWVQGVYWEGEGGTVLVGNYASHGLAYQAAAPYIIPFTGADPAYKTSYTLTANGTQANITYVSSTNSYTVVMAYRESCAGLDEEAYCPSERPVLCGEDWEPDSTTNYSLVNGCITGSSCDPDASEQAKQCNEQIKICDENGNERIIESIGNGQFIMYDESGTHKGGRYNAATGERLEVLDPGSDGGYGSIE